MLRVKTKKFFCLKFQLNQASGSVLVRLSIDDKDSPRNGPPFEFRLVSGNEGDFFTLDQTGTLRSNREFSPESPREFTLEVQVRNKDFFLCALSSPVNVLSTLATNLQLFGSRDHL